MSFRDKKPINATTLNIPALNEHKLIKKIDRFFPNLIPNKFYHFKIIDDIFKYTAMFKGKDIDASLIFIYVDRYDINYNLINDHNEIRVPFGHIELLNYKIEELTENENYRFRLVGTSSEYYGKFHEKSEYNYTFIRVQRYSKIGMFAEEFDKLSIPIEQVRVIYKYKS